MPRNSPIKDSTSCAALGSNFVAKRAITPADMPAAVSGLTAIARSESLNPMLALTGKPFLITRIVPVINCHFFQAISKHAHPPDGGCPLRVTSGHSSGSAPMSGLRQKRLFKSRVYVSMPRPAVHGKLLRAIRWDINHPRRSSSTARDPHPIYFSIRAGRLENIRSVAVPEPDMVDVVPVRICSEIVHRYQIPTWTAILTFMNILVRTIPYWREPLQWLEKRVAASPGSETQQASQSRFCTGTWTGFGGQWRSHYWRGQQGCCEGEFQDAVHDSLPDTSRSYAIRVHEPMSALGQKRPLA